MSSAFNTWKKCQLKCLQSSVQLLFGSLLLTQSSDPRLFIVQSISIAWMFCPAQIKSAFDCSNAHHCLIQIAYVSSNSGLNCSMFYSLRPSVQRANFRATTLQFSASFGSFISVHFYNTLYVHSWPLAGAEYAKSSSFFTLYWSWYKLAILDLPIISCQVTYVWYSYPQSIYTRITSSQRIIYHLAIEVIN